MASSGERKNRERFSRVYLDELITYEHTRCKPVAVSTVVSKDGHVLGLNAAIMPTIGKHLTEISKKKYGPRKNRRRAGLKKTLRDAAPCIAAGALFISDKESSYRRLVKQQFGEDAAHVTFKSKPASVAAQKELKTKEFDPLFPINHTFAMLRDRISSLVRHTWG